MCICNRVHLYTVFELLYSACHSVNIISCVCTSFNLLRIFYVILFRTSQKDVVRERERKREATSPSSRRHHQRRKTKQEYVAVACLQLSSSSGAVYKSRAVRHNELYGFRGRKAILNHTHAHGLSLFLMSADIRGH